MHISLLQLTLKHHIQARIIRKLGLNVMWCPVKCVELALFIGAVDRSSNYDNVLVQIYERSSKIVLNNWIRFVYNRSCVIGPVKINDIYIIGIENAVIIKIGYNRNLAGNNPAVNKENPI